MGETAVGSLRPLPQNHQPDERTNHRDNQQKRNQANRH